MQELSVPRCKKSGKEGKRPAWLSQHLLVKVKSKGELHRQGQVTWKECRDAARLCRDGVRWAKVQMELHLARDANTKRRDSTGTSARIGRLKRAYPADEQEWQPPVNR